MNSILSKLQISKNDSYLYEKALKIIGFMQTDYSGEDLRFVSAYLFNDSKIIDKNSKLRKLFNHFATVERPNIIYVRTDTKLTINSISIKELTEKLHLCALFGGDIKNLICEPSANIVISENLSFFMSAAPNNAIFLYSKGFHLIDSLSTFVKKLQHKNIMHFGDVDFEGLAIFEAFKKRIKDITFYPDYKTAKYIIDRYKTKLPKTNQKFEKCGYRNSQDIIGLISDGISIEQEFVHSLFYKNILEKPSWIK